MIRTNVPTTSIGSRASSRAALIAAFVLGSVGAGGFTLLPVTLPALQDAFDLSNGAVGLVSTLELIGVTSGALTAGVLVHRLPTRPFAITTMSVLLACGLATMLVNQIAVLAAVRLVDGVMAGAAQVICYSIIARSADRPDRRFALLAIFPLIYGTVFFWFVPRFEHAVGWHASFIVLCVTDLVGLVASFWIGQLAHDRSDAVRPSITHALPPVRGLISLGSIALYYVGVCAIYAFAFNMGVKMTGSDTIPGTILSLSQFVGMIGCVLAMASANRISRRAGILSGMGVTILGTAFLFAGEGVGYYLFAMLAINLAWNYLAGPHIGAVVTMDGRGVTAGFLPVTINGGAALGPLLGFTVSGDDYGLLLGTAVGLTFVSGAMILVALRGHSDLAHGGPVLEEKAVVDLAI
ncbi:MAG: MFS transporter [Nocardioides sp.]|uniref:MFS transporter n=1 Tax=Nocardioides sp. TaxID=35761 RepID=UPI0039E32005